MQSSSQRDSTRKNQQVTHNVLLRESTKSKFRGNSVPNTYQIRPSTGSSIFPPLAVSRVKSAPSTPRLQHRQLLSKTSSLTSLELDPIKANEFRRRRATYIGATEVPTPPMSPALRRKLIRTDCMMRVARQQIDDYRHENPSSIQPSESASEARSLAQALEEVKNCRYLRTVDHTN